MGIVKCKYFLMVVIFMLSAGLVHGQVDYHSPYKFIENKNQWGPGIHYAVDIPGGQVFLRDNKLTYEFLDREQIRALKHGHPTEKISDHHIVASNAGNTGGRQMIDGHRYSVTFLNANPRPAVNAHGRSPEYYNYFIGKDKARWAGHINAYYIVNYGDIYDNIHVSYYASKQGLKYDFLVKPGGCLEDIAMDYSGVEVELQDNGDLIVSTSLGEIVEKKPVAYQIIHGEKIPVRINYRLEGFTLGFETPGGYDRSYPLVIDPLLIFSTYSGSYADNWGNTATFNEQGNLFSGGITNHFRGGVELGEFIATDGAFQTEWGGMWDVAIIKYDSVGSSLEYATYLGGSGSETPHSIIVNNREELVIFGTTSSYDFPVTDNVYDNTFNGGTDTYVTIRYEVGTDFFISKLSADGGELLASTYVGGIENDGVNPQDSILTWNYGDELRGDVIVDDEDNVYLISSSSSPDLFKDANAANIFRQFSGGGTDAAVFKMTPDLRYILWGGFIGGSDMDAGYSIKLDSINNVFVAGGTNSTDFPAIDGKDTANLGGVDGWIAAIHTDGSGIARSTFVGTSGKDQVYLLDLDSEDNVFVAGQTTGTMPVFPEGQVYANPNSGQFIQKFNKGLDSISMSTVFGSGNPSPNISLTAFLVNECNNIYISGWGSDHQTFRYRGDYYLGLDTRGLPVTPNEALQSETNGSDFYLAVFSDNAERLLHGTFFGGGESIVHVDGGTSRFDKQGIVYHAVCADCDFGEPSLFTTTENAWSRVNNAVSDDGSVVGCNNAAFKFDLASLRADIQTNTVQLDQPGITRACYPWKVVFENMSVGGEVFDWDFGDGSSLTTSSKDTIIHTYPEPGTYNVSLRAFDPNTCVEEDFDYLTIKVFDHEFDVGEGGTICAGDEFRLSASGGVSYNWFPEDGLNDPNASAPVASPSDTTEYAITITDENECLYEDTVRVNVIPEVVSDFSLDKAYDCSSVEGIEVAFTGSGETLTWSLGDGSISQDSAFYYTYESPGDYNVALKVEREFCVDEKSVQVTINDVHVPNVITPNDDGLNDHFVIPINGSVGLKIFSRWGKLLFESSNYNNDWGGSDLSASVCYYELTFPDGVVCTGWLNIKR